MVPRRSLDNLSNQIRWSLDLRWQRPDLPNGFYGLKDCIVMAKAGEAGYAPDWTHWARQDRTPMQKAAVSADRLAEVSEADKEAAGSFPHQPLPMHHQEYQNSPRQIKIGITV